MHFNTITGVEAIGACLARLISIFVKMIHVYMHNMYNTVLCTMHNKTDCFSNQFWDIVKSQIRHPREFKNFFSNAQKNLQIRHLLF